jgi:hypothetical protein
MDLSVYITELLAEQGTINIPQIGVFTQVRMRGYYNAEEGKLYPPHYQTQFENKAVNDDTLLQYITVKSKVSTTSAQYFIDKYLHNILQQAEIGEALLGRLGWISKEGDTINFRPAPASISNETAFGFAPISIDNGTKFLPPVEAPESSTESPVSQGPAPSPTFSVEKNMEPQPHYKPFETSTTPAKPSLLRQHAQTDHQPAAAAIGHTPVVPPVETESPAIDNYDEPKFYSKPWFFGLVAGLIIIGAILYYYPSADDMLNGRVKPAKAAPSPSMDSVVIKKTSPVIAVKDTAVKDSTTQATTKAVPATPVIAAPNQPLPSSTEFAPEVENPRKPADAVLENTQNYKFVLMSGAFSNTAEAVKVVNRYKTIGVPAAILKNVSPSKYVKVTLGFFKTYADGQAAKNKLVKLKHLRSRDLYVETLRKKKK